MNHTIPIYQANIKMSIVNKRSRQKRAINSPVLKGCIVKGFTMDDILKRYNFNRIKKQVADKFKLLPNEEFVVDRIEFIRQLGFGIKDESFPPA